MSGTEQTIEADDKVVMFGVPDTVRAALDRVKDTACRRLLVRLFQLRKAKSGDAADEVVRTAKEVEILCRAAGDSGRAEARVQLAASVAKFSRGDDIREQLLEAGRYLLKSALLVAWLITWPVAWIVARVRAYPLAAAFFAFGLGAGVMLYASLSVRESIMPVAFELPEPALPHFANIHAVRHAGRVFLDAREPGVVFLETITKDGRIAAIYKCAASNPPPPRVEDVLVVAKAPSPELGPRTTVDPRILYDCRHQPEAVAHLKSRYADGRPIPVASHRVPSDPRYKSVDAADVPVATVRRARPHNVPDAATAPVPVEPLKKP